MRKTITGTGGMLLLQTLKDAGVEYLFTNPGSAETGIFAAIAEDGDQRLVMGKHEGARYLPYFLSIFFFIVFMNLLGLVPWSATATASIAVTGGLALTTLFALVICGMVVQGPIAFWKNLVPHVPDECRLGAGYQPARPHENRDILIDGEPRREIPLRVCTFVKTAVFQKDEQTVVYLFHANGDFASTREQVRIAFNDPRDRFAYFSKVEISFPRASREQSVEGAARLLSKLLPILVSDHLPDFENAEKSAVQ